MILSLESVPAASFARELGKAPKTDRQIVNELYHTATYATAGLAALMVNNPGSEGKPGFAKLIAAVAEAAPKLEKLLLAIDPTYVPPPPTSIKLPFANPARPTLDEVDSTVATVALNVFAIADHYTKSTSPGAKEKAAAASEANPAMAKLLEGFKAFAAELGKGS